MNNLKIIFSRLFIFFVTLECFCQIPSVKSAEEVKIIYSIFSRTIEVESIKSYSETGQAQKKLKGILRRTNSSKEKIQEVLKKNFDIPLTIASKLMYSEIGNVVLTRLSKIIHPPRARDEVTGKLALRASVIKAIDLGEGKINLINFLEGYPTKTVILNVNALSKILNKVESISELLEFFTDSPLNKIKEN